MQIFRRMDQLSPEQQLRRYRGYFKLANPVRTLFLFSAVFFLYGQFFLSLNNLIPLPADRLSMAIGFLAVAWFLTGISFLIVIAIQKFCYYLPRRLIIAISLEEAIQIRNSSSPMLVQKEQAILGKSLRRLGVSLSLFKSNRQLHKSEKKALSNLCKRYPYLKELILTKDKSIFAILEPYLRQIAEDFRTNSMPKFVEDYREFEWTLERLTDYWEIRENYLGVKVGVTLRKAANIVNHGLEEVLAFIKTSHGLGLAAALVISSILEYFVR